MQMKLEKFKFSDVIMVYLIGTSLKLGREVCQQWRKNSNHQCHVWAPVMTPLLCFIGIGIKKSWPGVEPHLATHELLITASHSQDIGES